MRTGVATRLSPGSTAAGSSAFLSAANACGAAGQSGVPQHAAGHSARRQILTKQSIMGGVYFWQVFGTSIRQRSSLSTVRPLCSIVFWPLQSSKPVATFRTALPRKKARTIRALCTRQAASGWG